MGRIRDNNRVMSSDPGRGVFISHISEEAPVAEVLKLYLKAAFGEKFDVFQSSDKVSIEVGESWHGKTLEGLRKARSVIVLLSAESCRRSWINFEAGMATDPNVRLIPLILSRFSASLVSGPLAGMECRSIDDIGLVIDAIEQAENIERQQIDIDQYQRDVRKAEEQLNYKSIIVTPIIEGHYLEFDIENQGNIDLELLMLEFSIPTLAVRVDVHPAYQFDSRQVRREETQYTWCGNY